MKLSIVPKYILLIILVVILSGAVYLTFVLDRDFLTEFGLNGITAIVGLTVVLSGKLLCEFLYFRLKGVGKYLIGSFAFLIIVCTLLSIFFVRVQKSVGTHNHKTEINHILTERDQNLIEDRKLLKEGIVSIESQIKSKQSQITKLDTEKDKWLILRYQKEVGKLNNQKLTLITKMQDIKPLKIKDAQKETSLHSALNQVFGTDPTILTLSVNFLLTIITEGIILVTIFSISLLWSPKTNSIPEKNSIPVVQKTVYQRQKKSIPENNTIPLEEKNNEWYIQKLEKAFNNAGLSQEKFALEKLGITKMALYKIRTGKTKNISRDVKAQIEAL